MQIIVRNTDSRPIYEQVSSQIKLAVLRGEAEHGQLLPSIRQLAKELRVSVITTRRAYEELEREGFIEMVPGKGCFVNAHNQQSVREEYLRRAEAHLEQALDAATLGGLSLTELQELLRILGTS